MRKIEVTSKLVGLVPIDKHDHEAAERAIAAGYPAVESSLPQLLEWLQDMNWPVAQTLAPFLASISKPLIPHLKVIFETDDEIWKAWIISRIIGESPLLATHFRSDLEKLVNQETHDEDAQWVRENAQIVLEKYRWL